MFQTYGVTAVAFRPHCSVGYEYRAFATAQYALGLLIKNHTNLLNT